ncbi:hypothetical protein L208DRAFT_1421146 [Tricholoma matsutake]|nr:hypothetical protein L208DRAFT_1421146 [Tricholoma matsutake 945]
MGIPGLWDILRPAEKIISFTELTVKNGFEANGWGTHSFVIGGLHAQAGKNPELCILYYRLAWLLKLPVTAVFVFDGPKRPLIKCGKRVIANTHWLTQGLKEFVVAFGFHVHMVLPTEAELAQLNRTAIIDAILTDDGDCLVFRATCIIRNPNVKLDGDSVALYMANALGNHPCVSLMEGGLLLIMLLIGGDYDVKGLHSCGTRVAYSLAHSGLGDSLLQAACSSGPHQLMCFLVQWCLKLWEELMTNASGHLARKQPSLARKVPATFPNQAILLQYANPCTSWTESTPPNISCWTPGQIDLGNAALLCEQFFPWGMASGIMKNFCDHIYAGACVQCLSLFSSFSLILISQPINHLSGIILDGPFTPANILQIEHAHHGPTQVVGLPGYCIELTTYSLVNAIISKLRGICGPVPDGKGLHPKTFVWVLASILDHALPQLVQQYELSKKWPQVNFNSSCSSEIMY